MPRRAFRSGAWWGALVVGATAACLPQGPPPTGRQVVADRGAALAALVPPNGDGLLRVLLLRPGANPDSADLSVVSLDADSNPSPEVPLISDIDPVYGVGCRPYGVAPCSVDASGAVQVHRPDGSWLTVNALTGTIEPPAPGSLGTFGGFGLSETPGGRSYHPLSPTTGTLTDAAGNSVPIQLAPGATAGSAFQFLGEDFCYVDPQQNLIDVPPSNVPRQLTTQVIAFRGVGTPDGPVVILTRVTSPPPTNHYSVLDAKSGTETMLPFDGSNASVSPDGNWVLDSSAATQGQFTFFDYRSNAEHTVQIDGEGGWFQWRPGTAEAWITSFGVGDMDTVWVVRPDAPPISVPGAYMENVPMDAFSRTQPFTPDGTYWFYTTSPDSAAQVIQVARGDDPTGPAFPLNPPSTFLGLAQPLPDGRFLTSSYPKDPDRSDVSVVDPRTGQTDVLARRGLLVTSGATRLMGLFHIAEARGDLTTIDLDSGQATILATEFTARASAEPQGSDALAAGTRIVYQFQARTASPYDGIWVTTCP